jgi:RTX calcium-binding nonapeptide repeat (4 copies)
MALKSYNTNWQRGSYESDRNYAIQRAENPKLLLDGTENGVYADSKASDANLAIGYGYDLIVRPASESAATINGVLGSGEISEEQIAILEARRTGNLLHGSVPDNPAVQGAWSKITLTQDQAEALLNSLVPKWEDALSQALKGHNIPESRERAALISILYNLSGSTAESVKRNIPTTLKIIENNEEDPTQRAKIWYEIKFNTNGGKSRGEYGKGLANRRDLEADLFSLYQEEMQPSSEEEALAIVYYLERKRIGIERYIKSINGSNDWYTPAVKRNVERQLEYYLNPAKEYLTARYSNAIKIHQDANGRIYVFVGTDEKYQNSDGNKLPDSDTLTGSENNDLIFGQSGDDLLFGVQGDDVIYGGQGKDVLEGGEGNDLLFAEHRIDGTSNLAESSKNADTLIGGEGNDTLFGVNVILSAGGDIVGYEDDNQVDVLFGGKGKDKFYVGKGDIIIDDGLGSGDTDSDEIWMLPPGAKEPVLIDGEGESGGVYDVKRDVPYQLQHLLIYSLPSEVRFNLEWDDEFITYFPISSEENLDITYYRSTEGTVLQHGEREDEFFVYLRKEELKPIENKEFGIEYKYPTIDSASPFFEDEEANFFIGQEPDKWRDLHINFSGALDKFYQELTPYFQPLKDNLLKTESLQQEQKPETPSPQSAPFVGLIDDEFFLYILSDEGDFMSLDDVPDPAERYVLAFGGNDTIQGTESEDFYVNGNIGTDLINLLGGDDRALGGRNSDTLDGGTGGDFLAGNYDDDSIVGGAGDDTLRGGKGSDVLIGSDGDDFLAGDLNQDLLSGGAGRDIYVPQNEEEAGISILLDETDIITDFNMVEGDRIGLIGSTQFSDLSFELVDSDSGGTSVSSTAIKLMKTGSYLGIVQGIAPASFAESNFTNVSL